MQCEHAAVGAARRPDHDGEESMMSANWKKEFRKEIESPNTPPEEAEKLAVTLLHYARRGDADAERELMSARLARKHAGLPPIQAVEHWIDYAMALHAVHGKEASLDLCFRPDAPKNVKKLNKLTGLDKFPELYKDWRIIHHVKLAIEQGFPTFDASKDSDGITAFKVAAIRLEGEDIKFSKRTKRDGEVSGHTKRDGEVSGHTEHDCEVSEHTVRNRYYRILKKSIL
ncbi:MAG: hypothetical protein AB1768_20965 [Pseudomonadota bacterium]|jgi:hypothetical protein